MRLLSTSWCVVPDLRTLFFADLPLIISLAAHSCSAARATPRLAALPFTTTSPLPHRTITTTAITKTTSTRHLLQLSIVPPTPFSMLSRPAIRMQAQYHNRSPTPRWCRMQAASFYKATLPCTYQTAQPATTVHCRPRSAVYPQALPLPSPPILPRPQCRTRSPPLHRLPTHPASPPPYGHAQRGTTTDPNSRETYNHSMFPVADTRHSGLAQSCNAAPVGAVNQHASQSEEVLFRCQWNTCSSAFHTREELVGHVTVAHLLEAQATPKPASQLRTPSQLAPAASWDGSARDHQQESFDHSLKCLWDSCNVPLTSPNVLGTAFPDNGHAHSLGHHGHSNAGNDAYLDALPDTSTATLVRHLLQDHLHLPTGLLSSLGNSMSDSSGTSDPSVIARQPVALSNAANNTAFNRVVDMNAFSAKTSEPMDSASLGNTNGARPFDMHRIPSLDILSGVAGPILSSGPDKLSDPSSMLLPHLSSSVNAESPSVHTCNWESCTCTFPTTAALMDHIGTEHIGSGKSMYFCRWKDCERAHAGRGFNQRQKILRHVRTHAGDKPFVCKVCGRGFSESTTLAQVSE